MCRHFSQRVSRTRISSAVPLKRVEYLCMNLMRHISHAPSRGAHFASSSLRCCTSIFLIARHSASSFGFLFFIGISQRLSTNRSRPGIGKRKSGWWRGRAGKREPKCAESKPVFMGKLREPFSEKTGPDWGLPGARWRGVAPEKEIPCARVSIAGNRAPFAHVVSAFSPPPVAHAATLPRKRFLPRPALIPRAAMSFCGIMRRGRIVPSLRAG